MDRFEVTIEGRTPMLMHFNNLEARDRIQARGRSGGKAGDDRTPPDMWKSSLYVSDDCVALPSENLLAALLNGGKKVSIGNRKTLKEASQAIFFDDFMIPLLVNGKKIARSDIEAIEGDFSEHVTAARGLGFSLFVKPATVNGKSHVRVRPRFDAWSLKLTCETDHEDLLTGEGRMQALWTFAGKAGVGDWRPSSPKKPGMFGVFNAKVQKI